MALLDDSEGYRVGVVFFFRETWTGTGWAAVIPPARAKAYRFGQELADGGYSHLLYMPATPEIESMSSLGRGQKLGKRLDET